MIVAEAHKAKIDRMCLSFIYYNFCKNTIFIFIEKEKSTKVGYYGAKIGVWVE
jgi:hypothetical protein